MNVAAILLRAIQNKLLLDSNTFEDWDEEEVFSGRDDRDFDEKWMRLYNQLDGEQFDEVESQMISRLRESAFITTFKHTSDPELSAYVSDDFEVIAKGVATGRDDRFLVELLESYIKGKIPYGRMVSSGASIDVLMDTLRSEES